MSEVADVNKPTDQQKCIICNYQYFIEINFRFHPKECDGWHNLMQKTMRKFC